MRFVVVKKRSIALFLICFFVFSVVILSLQGSGTASVYFGESIRRVPIYRVRTEEKKIALTFDAAWGADKTDGIIEILQRYQADATFFLVGFWMENFAEKTKQIDAAGFEIGTHSNTHPHMARLSSDDIRKELSVCTEKIKSLTGKDVSLFRAPFGEYNDRVIEGAEALGLTTIQWDVDSLDWKSLPVQETVTRVLSKARPGSIVLFHNNSEHILEVLPPILTALADQGYSFVRVSDLIYRENFTVDSRGEQIRN